MKHNQPTVGRFHRLWRFHGGLHLPPKKSMSTSALVLTAKVPPILTLPLTQHIGEPAKPVVKVGEHVLKGQVVAKAKGYVSASVHAPSSGIVVAIEKRPVPHPSGLDADCIVIETDGKEQWRWRANRIDDYTKLDPSELRNRLRQAGVVGLGGAGFPTFVKMNPGLSGHIELLVLNGVECEPYISCDDMLMRENPWEIVGGLHILRHAVQARVCVIALEDNKPKAFAAMKIAV
ncbi:MAG: RnfABCDGE type electron transport complex subunit C, partial [Gammaproteobacteria bacterium]